MANTIKFKRSSGSDPSASDLAIGEPGLRTDTAELFFKKDDGTVAKVSGGGGGPDFKYLELRNAANDGAASYPANDFTLVSAGTTNAITPTAANTLLVSVSGVIQKPNAGTSTSGITGFIVDGSRLKTATNLPAAPDFIIYQESGGIGEPSDNTVTSAKIVDGAIVNADVNASAAIAGTKISPDFGSQNISTNGHISLPDLSELRFGGGNDLKIYHQGGSPGSNHIQSLVSNLGLNITTSNGDIKLRYGTSGKDFIICDGVTDKNVELYQNGSKRFETNSSGISVTGDITVSGSVDGRDLQTDGTKLDGIQSGATDDQTAAEIKTLLNSSGLVDAQIDASAAIAGSKVDPSFTSDITITNTQPKISLVDTNANDDFEIKVNAGNFAINDATNSENRFLIDSTGTVDISGNLDVGSGLDVTGNISVSGTVDGRDLATDGSKLDGIAANATNVTNNNQLTNGAGYVTSNTTYDLSVPSGTTKIRLDPSDSSGNDDVEIAGGTNITVTRNNGNKLTIAGATQTDNNFTTTLKNKLDGIAAGATNVTNNNQISNGAGYLTDVSTSDIDNSAITTDKLNNSAVTTNKINNDAVTFAKLENVAQNRILGRNNSGTGNCEELTASEVRTLLNVADGATNVTNNNQLTNGAGYITSSSIPTVTGAAKKFVNFDGTNNSIRNDLGVSSISDHGAGQYTVNFDGNFANTDYTITHGIYRGSGKVLYHFDIDNSITTSSHRFMISAANNVGNVGLVARDTDQLHLAFFLN